MRPVRVAVIACFVQLAGCGHETKSSKPVVRELKPDPLCDELSPLNDAEVQALGEPDGFLDLLPQGRRTAVGLIADPDGSPTPIGFAYLVRTGAGRLTARLTRRELERLAQPKAVTAPLVILTPAPRDGSDKICVAVIASTVPPLSLMSLGGLSRRETRRKRFAQLLDSWRDNATLEIESLGPGWVEVAVRKVRDGDLDDLATDLAGALHDSALDADDVADLIKRNATIRIPI